MTDTDDWFLQADRGLNLARRSSGRMLNEMSMAQLHGATNLLTKAARALGTDDARAQRLIDRAAAMPWDDREERFMGVQAAASLVHAVVSDAFEDADVDDLRWLDAVEGALDRVGAHGQAQIRSTVRALAGPFFETSSEEERRLLAVAGDAPVDAEHVTEDAGVAERADVIRDLVGTYVVLVEALEPFVGP